MSFITYLLIGFRLYLLKLYEPKIMCIDLENLMEYSKMSLIYFIVYIAITIVYLFAKKISIVL